MILVIFKLLFILSSNQYKLIKKMISRSSTNKQNLIIGIKITFHLEKLYTTLGRVTTHRAPHDEKYSVELPLLQNFEISFLIN